MTVLVVRRRADGWVVWDDDARMVRSHHDTEAEAEAEAIRSAASWSERTYGVTWYVEVDATSDADAIAKAKKFLLPTWRENWEPTSVEVVE